MTRLIHLRACRRSGTNYLQWLLEENFQARIDHGGWKHSLPNGEEPFITIIRHPFAYAASVLDYYGWNDPEDHELQYIAETWTGKNAIYTDYCYDRAKAVQIRYEDLVDKESWERQMRKIQHIFDLKLVPDEFQDTNQQVDPHHDDEIDPDQRAQEDHRRRLEEPNRRYFKRALSQVGGRDLLAFHDYA